MLNLFDVRVEAKPTASDHSVNVTVSAMTTMNTTSVVSDRGELAARVGANAMAPRTRTRRMRGRVCGRYVAAYMRVYCEVIVA
jgi:hypothetical protein